MANEEHSPEMEGSKGRRKRKARSATDIAEKLSEEERNVVIASLHRVLKPFLLRREKKDIQNLDIPLKTERIIYCPWTALQLKVYDDLMDAVDKKYIPEGKGSDGKGGGLQEKCFFSAELSTANVTMQLRKLCNHPYLLLEDMLTLPDDLYYQFVVSSCGKLLVLVRLLFQLLQPKEGTHSSSHKILLFCQMTSMLNILEGVLQRRSISYARLDGSTSYEEREEALFSFNTDPNTAVFLLSTRAGGVGLNLQAADTVIFFDSDYNPQMDCQAIGRAHRLGQTKPVLVLRLVMAGIEEGVASVEQEILRVAERKLLAEREVLVRMKIDINSFYLPTLPALFI